MVMLLPFELAHAIRCVSGGLVTPSLAVCDELPVPQDGGEVSSVLSGPHIAFI